jgi:C-terminal processing protease CtpA/Prc
MSSAESFVFMFAQCPQVTTMGDRTAGSSGNPRRIEAGAGIVVNLPRWLDMGPDGRPIDEVGIQPEIHLDVKPEEFTNDRDPVLAAALEHLRDLRESGTHESTSVLRRR